MVITAASAPVVVGAKCPWMVQLAMAARVAPQVFAKTNEVGSAPPTVMLVIDKAVVPVLVSVTDCDELDTPTAVAGKLSFVAESVTGGVNPVPLKAMLCGDVLPLSMIVTAAFNAPVVVGAKCPWIVQFAPTARLVPQLFANTKEDAFAPVTAILVIDNAVLPVFVMVTV